MGTVGSEDVMLSAICVPVISSPVQGQCPRQAVRNYPHLAGLTLADDCEGEAQVDILVGADQYWNLVTGGVIRGESGPTAIHTKLGWVLSGPVHYQVPSSSTTINLTSTHVLKCQVTNHKKTSAPNFYVQTTFYQGKQHQEHEACRTGYAYCILRKLSLSRMEIKCGKHNAGIVFGCCH